MNKYTHINAKYSVAVADNKLYKISRNKDLVVKESNIEVVGKILQLFEFDGSIYALTDTGIYSYYECGRSQRFGYLNFTEVISVYPTDVGKEYLYGIGNDGSLYNAFLERKIDYEGRIKKLVYDSELIILGEDGRLNIEHPANGSIVDLIEYGGYTVLTSNGKVYVKKEKFKIDNVNFIKQIYDDWDNKVLVAVEGDTFHSYYHNNTLRTISKASGRSDGLIEARKGCYYYIGDSIYRHVDNGEHELMYTHNSKVKCSSVSVGYEMGYTLVLHEDGTIFRLDDGSVWEKGCRRILTPEESRVPRIQLLDRMSELENRVKELETHIECMPDGKVYLESLEHFNSLKGGEK